MPLRVQRVVATRPWRTPTRSGLGPSRRVVLWDTLLDGRFTPQVDVVLAHELGHHSSDHIPKAIGWFTLFALPGAFLLMLATRRRGGMGEPAAIPLALLVVAVLQLAATPAQNLVSRRMEAEADWKALQTTHDPAAARGLFRRARGDLARRSEPAVAGRNYSSAHTRRSPTASRWPTPGRPDAGRSCQARCHVLFGRGVLRQVHGMPSTVSCICRASERLRAGLRRARHEATSEPDASGSATAR